MQITAVVIGATGALGKQLVTQLSQREEVACVVVIVRRELDLPRDFPAAITSKIQVRRVDFAQLASHVIPLLPAQSVAFVALGTTKKQAGSNEAFRRVDHDLVLTFARACKAAKVRRLGVVTAHGANAGSTLFYNRVKGELEASIEALGLPCVFFARPSLLLGRPDDGRLAEKMASVLLAPAARLLPSAVRPITTARVAAAMIDAGIDPDAQPPLFILSNAAMHQR